MVDNSEHSTKKHCLTYMQNIMLTGNIYLILFIPIGISLSILLLWSGIIAPQISENVDLYSSLIGAISMTIASLSGIIQIIRRESPRIIGKSVRGRWPILSGILFVAICWLLVVYFLHLAISGP